MSLKVSHPATQLSAAELELYRRLNDCIEAEMRRIEVLRDGNNTESFYMARGRLQAWRAVTSALQGIEDNLPQFETYKEN